MIEKPSTPQQVADFLGVSRAKIMAFIAADELKAVNHALPGATRKRYKILPSDLAAFLESRKTRGPEPKKRRKKRHAAEPVGAFKEYLKERGRA